MGVLLSLGYLLLTCSVVFLLKKLQYLSSRPPYPPGPKPSLISGNAGELPTVLPWLKYAEWAKEYGDIVHVREYNKHVVILNDLKDVIALFDKRSRIYSDRPDAIMIPLCVLYFTIPREVINEKYNIRTGWDFNSGLIRYGDPWRRHRRLYRQAFNKDETRIVHEPSQTLKIHELLHQFLVAPEGFTTHFRNAAGAIVMATVYDKNISKSEVERFVAIAEYAMARMSEILFPGAFLVNALPFLRHIPAWFPGTGFHAFAADCRLYTNQLREDPFKNVKDRMAAGIEVSSLTARLLKRNSALGPMAQPEEDLKAVTATSLIAGADTTVSAIGTFIYAILLHVDAQKKAQDEIDSVVGPYRLPNFSDRPNMPYVEALYREVMRWHPVTPLGVSHASTADDVYNGYFIPKGTEVIPNIWSMTHDESRYPEPDSFKPERFFDDDGQLNDDDTVLTFGFGRRTNSTFDIRKPRDEQGNEIDVDNSYTSGLISHKIPHSCSITPRSEQARKLVIEANAAAQLLDAESSVDH
ncbi:hypothetical protein C0995_004865 [Termitomyces sp. Mi166|nr:hypothetical protein C0995_004865 [Termitomyces sp. Mi166\